MRYKLGLLLLILATILAACNGDADSTATETGDSDATQTAPQVEGDTTELTETFSGATAASGTLTVNYPAGWTQTGTADALSLTNTDAGEAISITVMPAATTASMGDSPTAILTSFASNTAAASGITFSDAEEATYNGNPGAVVTATGNGADTVIAIVEVNESYVFLSYTASEGNMEANRAVLEAIASSVSLSS